MILNNDCIGLLSLFYGIPCTFSQQFQPNPQLNKRYSYAVEQVINPYHLLGPLKRAKEMTGFPALDHTAVKNEDLHTTDDFEGKTGLEVDLENSTDLEDDHHESNDKEVSAPQAKRFPSNEMPDPWTERLWEDKFSGMDKRFTSFRMPREFIQSLKDDGLIPPDKRGFSYRMSKQDLIDSLKSQGLIKRLAAEKRFTSFRMKPHELLQSLRNEGLLPPEKRFTSFRMSKQGLMKNLQKSGLLAFNKRFTSFRMSKQDLIASLKAQGVFPSKRMQQVKSSPLSKMMANDDLTKEEVQKRFTSFRMPREAIEKYVKDKTDAYAKRFTSFRFRPEFMAKEEIGSKDFVDNDEQELEKRPQIDEDGFIEYSEKKYDDAKSKVRARLARYLEDKGFRSKVNDEMDSSIEEPLALASTLYRQANTLPTSRGLASFLPTFNRDPIPKASRQLSFLPTSSRITLGNREVQDDLEEDNDEYNQPKDMQEVDNDLASMSRLSRPFPLIKKPPVDHEESRKFPGIPAYYHNALFG